MIFEFISPADEYPLARTCSHFAHMMRARRARRGDDKWATPVRAFLSVPGMKWLGEEGILIDNEGVDMLVSSTSLATIRAGVEADVIKPARVVFSVLNKERIHLAEEIYREFPQWRDWLSSHTTWTLAVSDQRAILESVLKCICLRTLDTLRGLLYMAVENNKVWLAEIVVAEFRRRFPGRISNDLFDPATADLMMERGTCQLYDACVKHDRHLRLWRACSASGRNAMVRYRNRDLCVRIIEHMLTIDGARGNFYLNSLLRYIERVADPNKFFQGFVGFAKDTRVLLAQRFTVGLM